jgi:hypothetical protein
LFDRDAVRCRIARQTRDNAGEPAACAVGEIEERQRRFDGARGDVHNAAVAARDHAVERCLDEF